MTNEEWLEHLAHNDIPGLRAWFKAEHVEPPESEALVQCAQIDVEDRERAAEGDTAALNAKLAELERKLRISWEYECKFQAERDELQAKVDELKELNEYHALQYELASEDAGRLQAQVDRLTDERERYREKFGKCIDYADAIHALMDDEGLA